MAGVALIPHTSLEKLGLHIERYKNEITVQDTRANEEDGTDKLVNVELAQFTDQSVDLSKVNAGPRQNGTPWRPGPGREDEAFTITAESLLQGWTDPNGDVLSVTDLELEGSGGQLVANKNGSWQLVPDKRFQRNNQTYLPSLMATEERLARACHSYSSQSTMLLKSKIQLS